MRPLCHLGQTLPLFCQGTEDLAVILVGCLVRALQHLRCPLQGIGRVMRLGPVAIRLVVTHLRNSDTINIAQCLDRGPGQRHMMVLPMKTGSIHVTLAVAALLASVAVAQAQQADDATSPPSAAQLNARAASDVAQAVDMAASPNAQPALLLGPDGKLVKSGSSTAGLYDHQNVPAPKPAVVNPNDIHYPYGRAALGNIDPTSAANPYSPYGSLPSPAQTYGNYSSPSPGIFHGGLPAGSRGH